MISFINSLQKSILLKPIARSILLTWLIGLSMNCTFETPQAPETPTFYQTLNLPMTDVTLPLEDLHNPENSIFADTTGDSMYFYFTGSLDTATLTEDIFVVPASDDIHISQEFSQLDEANIEVDTSITQTVKLSDKIPLPGVTLPVGYDVTLDSIPEDDLLNESEEIQLYDRYSIPFFQRVDYLTIADGTFRADVDNHLLTDLKDVEISLRNKNFEEISRLYFDIAPDGMVSSRGDQGNLAGEKLRDVVQIVLTAAIAGSDGQPVTIPAGMDPYVTLTIGLEIDSVRSVTGKPESFELENAQALPPSNNTIIKGVFSDPLTNPADTNQITLQVENNLSASFNMTIQFLNFYDDNGALTIDQDIATGTAITTIQRLDADTLRNPDATSYVDSLIIITEVTFLPDAGDTVTTIYLNVNNQSIDFTIGVALMKFSEITGFFNESFEIPPLTIDAIPSGFSGIDFGNVYLLLHMFNEIQATTELTLTITGVREDMDSRTVTGSETIAKASDEEPVVQSDMVIDIAPVFNMPPDSILVNGDAAIPANDTSRLQVGKSFWGTYEVFVPFRVKLESMVFIPVSSTILDPFDSETSQRLRDGFIEASLLSNIKNHIGIGGKIQLLLSNYDYFPLDSTLDELDSGYQWIDSVLYAETDTGLYEIEIDTLVTIDLPIPTEYNIDGSVLTEGEVDQSSEIDSLTFQKIIGNDQHFLRPRVFLEGEDRYITMRPSDYVQIKALMSITLQGDKFLDFSVTDDSTGIVDE